MHVREYGWMQVELRRSLSLSGFGVAAHPAAPVTDAPTLITNLQTPGAQGQRHYLCEASFSPL